MSFFRYPGGKKKLLAQVLDRLHVQSDGCTEYREPFFGGGSIGIHYIKEFNPTVCHINDKDVNLAALWTSVIAYPELLSARVLNYTPVVEDFWLFRTELEEARPVSDVPEEIVDRGFKKLAIHQISYSGLGTKSGSPLGGRAQASAYKIDCRWSPAKIASKIKKNNELFKLLEVKYAACTSLDFSSLLDDTSTRSLVYLDPPYYVKGNSLYQEGFTQDDHLRLAQKLQNTEHAWVLSYDDCPEIRELYNWATVEELKVKYSITSMRDKVELLITK
jgi:DNA adenine methylase